LAVAACYLVLPVAVPGQTIDVVEDAHLPRFEVVSIKPGVSSGGPVRIGFPPGRFVQENMNLLNALMMAFSMRPYQLGTVPDLIQRERFTITAKMADDARAQDRALMLRALLVDRFKLRYH